MKFTALPAHDLTDVTLDLEQLQQHGMFDDTALGGALSGKLPNPSLSTATLQKFPQLPSAQTLHVSTGFITSAAAISAGTGDFTVSHPSTGHYTVSNATWPSAYAVVVSPTETGGVLTAANLSTVGAGSFSVVTFITTTGTAVDTGFSFIVFY